MSALARYFKFLGMEVAGYDLTQTALTDKLISEGIQISFTEKISSIPSSFIKEDTLVVYTPAVPKSHKGYCWFSDKGYTIYKRAQVLGMICNASKCIAVAGTHGKTTVSSMASVILHESGQGCGAFLGGILKNYHSNLILPDNKKQWLVTEADEYDRSFLNLTPDIALITAIDPDHLDIYGDIDELKKSFAGFAGLIRENGKLIIKKGVGLPDWNPKYIELKSYALIDEADYYATGIELSDEGYIFDLNTPFGKIENIKLSFPGIINVENAVAASAIATEAGATPDAIKNGLAAYQGVARRFDIRFRNNEMIFIDDYAHHPKELEAVITSARELYKGKEIAGIFQPHLFTRTRDFADEFAKSLSLLDKVAVLPIYPAREQPIEGVNSEMIIRKIKNKNVVLLQMDEVVPWVAENRFEVLMALGAGSIDKVAGEIAKCLEEKYG